MFKLNPCCCFNLRTGAFLIGIFELIFWTASLTVTTISVAFSIAISNGFQQFHETSNSTNNSTHEFHSPQQSSNVTAGMNSMLLIACLTLSLSAIRIIAACALLLGIQRESICMLISYISVKAVTFLLTLMLFIGSALFMKTKYEAHRYEEIYGEENSNAYSTADGIITMNGTSINNGHRDANTQSQSYSPTKPQAANVLMLFTNFIISVYFIYVIICLVKDIKAKQIATPEFNTKKV